MPYQNAELDLLANDPHRIVGYNTIDAPDDFLHRRLGSDYHRYLAMRRDGYVRSRIERRRSAVLARTLLTAPGTEQPSRKQKRSIEAVTTVTSSLSSGINYESLCSALLGSGYLIGFSVIRVDWQEINGGLIAPRYTFVEQNRFYFAPHTPDDRTVYVATDENLDPATEIVLVQGYELRLLTRRAPIWGERCPRDRFVCYTFSGDESPWGLGLGYSIYPWFTLKQESAQNWIRQGQNAGSPPLIGTRPAALNKTDPDVAKALQDFKGVLRAASPKAWASLPEGFSATVLSGLNNASPDIHERFIDAANREITVSIFGEVLYSDKSTGSYSANDSQRDAIEAALIDGDCNIFDEQLQRQLWEPFFRINKLEPIEIRRESRADRQNAENESKEEDSLKKRADRDAVLINQLKLIPSPEYIATTYGEQWSLPTADPDPIENLNDRATRDAAIAGLRTDLRLTEDYLAKTYGVKFEDLPQQDTSSTDSLQGLLDGSGGAATGDNGAIAADPAAGTAAPSFEELSIEYQEALAVLESMPDAIEFAERKPGKAKNCKKGYSCGNSCISKGKACKDNALQGDTARLATFLHEVPKTATVKTAKPKAEKAIAAPKEAKPIAATAKPKSKQPKNDNPEDFHNAANRQAVHDEIVKAVKSLGGEAYVAKVESHLASILKNADIQIRVPSNSVLESIIGDRFKTQHETATSKGILDPVYRSEIEKEHLNYQDNTPKEDRPIYGYLADRSGVYEHGSPELEQYGDLVVKLKPEVKDRSTFTFDDSFKKIDPSSINNPKATSLISQRLTNSGEDIRKTMKSVLSAKSVGDISGSTNSLYVESQIHGQVKPSDIREISFLEGYPQSEKVLAWAKANNVKITTRKSEEYDY